MDFKELQRVNSKLATVNIKGKDYVTVAERVIGFRELYPEGSISTEIISLSDGVVTMKATVSYGGVVLSTGYAQEKEGSNYINKTNFVEVCETSCVGRALGFLGIGIDTSIASADEVSAAEQVVTPSVKVQAQAQVNGWSPETAAAAEMSTRLIELKRELLRTGISPTSCAGYFGVATIDDMNHGELLKAIEMLKSKPDKEA